MLTVNELLEKQAQELDIDVQNYKGRALVGVRQTGKLCFTSGSGCAEFRQGLIGSELTFEDGYLACQHIATIQLLIMRDYLGDLDRVDQIMRVYCHITCDDSFTDLEGVFAGFTDVFKTVFGERGLSPHTILGSRNLPVGNTAAELEVIFTVRD